MSHPLSIYFTRPYCKENGHRQVANIFEWEEGYIVKKNIKRFCWPLSKQWAVGLSGGPKKQKDRIYEEEES